MTIDWSKAPEGATHKETSCPNGFWYRFDFERNTAEFCPTGSTEWSSSSPPSAYNDGSMDHMVPKPSSESSAKDRSKACDEMYGVILNMPEGNRHNRSDICEALYDAGYRKFEIVEDDV